MKELSGEPCSGHANRRIRVERVHCLCCNRHYQSATVGTLMKSNRILKEMKADLSEIKVHAHRDEKVGRGGMVRCCVGQSADLSSTLGNLSGVTTERILQGGIDGVTPIHHSTGKAKRKARSSFSAEVHALAYAEQELYCTRHQLAEFLCCQLSLSIVEDTVQRVGGGFGDRCEGHLRCDVWSFGTSINGGEEDNDRDAYHPVCTLQLWSFYGPLNSLVDGDLSLRHDRG